MVALPTSEGGDPSDLRIQNISTTGFEISQVEPQGRDGPHIPMTVSYIAAEAGDNRLPDGSRVIVGTINTSAIQASGSAGSYEPVVFTNALNGTPAVVANILTMNAESGNPPAGPAQPWLTTVIENVSSTGFDIAMERSQTTAGTPGTETIGYIAIEDGLSGAFLDTGGSSIDWSSTRSSATIQGWSDGCHAVTYSAVGFAVPRVVATKNSRTDSDGGWVRSCTVGATSIELRVDEDTAVDGERNHPAQVAGILAFDGSFHAEFVTDLSAEKTATLVEDPINGTANPYSLPGSRVRYTISVSNDGNVGTDDGTIDITDTMPPQTSLVVSDISGAGSGPVLFNDGVPLSGLTYSFGGLSDLSDSLAFSSDGGSSFNYVPIPAADGTDPNITHIAVHPSGQLDGAETGPAPNFSISFDILLQ